MANRCFYVKDRYLRLHEFGNGRDISLSSLRRTSFNMTPGIGGGPRSLQYNAFNKVCHAPCALCVPCVCPVPCSL